MSLSILPDKRKVSNKSSTEIRNTSCQVLLENCPAYGKIKKNMAHPVRQWMIELLW